MSKQKFISLFILSLIGGLLSLNSHAQAQSDALSARKLDEFGDIQLSDLKARLDNLAIELQNNQNTRGFIIVYRSRRDLPGLNNRLASLSKRYIAVNRGIPPDRLITVDGGVASCLWQELWVVPLGTAPTPRTDAYLRTLGDTYSARKFDEYYYPSPHGVVEEYDDTNLGDSLEAFADALQKEPRSSAYIIAYPQYYIERWEDEMNGRKHVTRRITHLDPPGTSQKMLGELRTELVKKYRVAASRIKLVEGGHRRQRQVELWIVPRGERAPIATPNAFPKRRQPGRG